MSQIAEVDLDKIIFSDLNPRLEFDPEGIEQLAQSIKRMGIIQPVILRKKGNFYEVVVGERRIRAAKKAGLKKIPAIIRDLTDDQVIELMLTENVQREDLSAVEKGNACKMLLEKYPDKYPTQAHLARALGVSPSTINEWLRLTEAPIEIQKMIAPATPIKREIPKGKIDYKTATSIIRTIKEPEKQIKIAKKIAERRIPERLARQIIREVAKEPEEPLEKVIEKVMERPASLPFMRIHADLILKGLKTQTSRKNIDPKIKPGAIVEAYSHFADLRITEITRKKLGDFTEEDAKMEGGYTLDEFKDVWKLLHKKWDPNEYVYVIKFEIAEKY